MTTTPHVGQGKECFCMSLCPIWVRVMIFESHEIQTTGLRTVIRDYFDSRKKRDFCENVV